MRSKAALSMLEQVIMLLIFAVAAALCMRAFVWAELNSAQSVKQDQAMVQLQSAAEIVKHCGGDFSAAAELLCGSSEADGLTVCYDEDWQVSDAGSYVLRVTRLDSGVKYLGKADLQLYEGDAPLASLQLCWQEVER